MRLFGFDISRRNATPPARPPACEGNHLRVRCIAATVDDRPELPATPFHHAQPAGKVTVALMRCESCGGLYTQQLYGAWTVEQLNGERLADSLLRGLERPPAPATRPDGRGEA